MFIDNNVLLEREIQRVKRMAEKLNIKILVLLKDEEECRVEINWKWDREGHEILKEMANAISSYDRDGIDHYSSYAWRYAERKEKEYLIDMPYTLIKKMRY